MSADGPPFDPSRLLAVLEQHEVTYLLVGGFAAQAHGAHRQTMDLDVVPRTSEENLQRLADALAALNARLRVGGISDEEAKQLPVVLDAATLKSFGSSTWMTDAGPIDVLADLRDADGGRHDYEDLATRVVVAEIEDLHRPPRIAPRHHQLKGVRRKTEGRRRTPGAPCAPRAI